LKAQENLHPQLFYALVKALQPLMLPNFHPQKVWDEEMKKREKELADELEDIRNARTARIKQKEADAKEAAGAKEASAPAATQSSSSSKEEEVPLSISFD
jgi:uncharacterized membrane protein YukC